MKKVFLLCSLAFCIVASAQFTKMYDFPYESQGENPHANLITDGIYFYGMTSSGGENNKGTIFKVKIDGTGFTKLLDFDGTNGSFPMGSLTISGNMLYGMTFLGGTYGAGVIFKLKTDGTGFTKLLDFDNVTGNCPYGSLTYASNTLYGMTSNGGSGSWGTAFKIKTDGTGFTRMINFDGSNGADPHGSFVLSGSTLYGMTAGSTVMTGNIFKIDTSGSGFTVLHNFYHLASNLATSEGFRPWGSLTLVGSVLYGMNSMGGENLDGTIYKINTNGSGFSKIKSFVWTMQIRSPYSTLTYLDGYLYGVSRYGNGNIFKMNTTDNSFSIVTTFDGVAKGKNPEYNSVLSVGGVLYGMTRLGGISDNGVLFKINPDGSGFTKLIDFISANNPKASLYPSDSILYGTSYGDFYKGCVFKINKKTNNFSKLVEFNGAIKGSFPKGSVIRSGNVLYGMTYSGGADDKGVIYKMNSDGSVFQVLLHFNGINGANPFGELVISGNTLFGMTFTGGLYNKGVLFKISTDGSDYTKLVEFDGTNGSDPKGTLILSNTELYGMTSAGGANNLGLAFKINTDGSGYKNLLDFDGAGNGSSPNGSLALSGNVLYGTTTVGGANGLGVAFKINPDGTHFKKIIDFDGAGKGSTPSGSLIICDSIIYGITSSGGSSNVGVTFKVDTSGKNFSKLVEFDGTIKGSTPAASLLLSSSVLYGITSAGGTNNLGTIFQYELPYPVTQVSGISFSNIQTNQADISWINGDGEKRIVFIKQSSAPRVMPVDSNTYTASDTFKLGSQLGTSGWYCLYNDTGTHVTVSGLIPNTNYSVAVYEYKGIPGKEKYLTKASVNNPAVLTTVVYIQPICIVRYDIQEKLNMIIWERKTGMNIKSYKILKEIATNTYDTLGTVAYNSNFSYYIDSTTNPDVIPMRYKICVIDSLGNKSPLSPYHRSINLSKNAGMTSDQLTLIWNEYEDESKAFIPSNYHIYRDNGTGTLKLYVDQAAGSMSYNVNVFNVVPHEMFQIVVDKNPACNPAMPLKADSGPYTQSLSNIVEYKVSAVTSDLDFPVSLYPNPFSKEINIEFSLNDKSDVLIEFLNATGQKTADVSYKNLEAGTQQIKINASEMNITDGMCYLKIIAGDKTSVIKCNYIK